MSNIKIDLITHDAERDEYALYIVEDGPWSDREIDERLQSIDDRVRGALLLVFEGAFAARVPESCGKNIRIQIDCHGLPPGNVEEFGRRLAGSLQDEYKSAIDKSKFVNALRIVTRSQMGRDDVAVGG